ncbi:MAG: cytochrome c nitrite reductase small subunit [Oligoflexia bacterium]|nr:cytochrome c nitrite reductase small subunit [Oligoflexia bacterium]
MRTLKKNSYFSPLKRWFILTFLGVLVGVITFLVHISNFFSYLSNDPKTCMNCHIMGPEYATWNHSSHREVATCNDCHVPHDNFVKKWTFKAMDGLRHATVFTLRGEPDAIIIKEAGVRAVQSNCQRCHSPLFVGMESWTKTNTFNQQNTKISQPPKMFSLFLSTSQGRTCWECHKLTPHGNVRGLSSTPFARVPVAGSMIPDWLKLEMKKEKEKEKEKVGGR